MKGWAAALHASKPLPERAQPSSRVAGTPPSLARKTDDDQARKRLPVTLIPAPSNEPAERWPREPGDRCAVLSEARKTPRTRAEEASAFADQGRPKLLALQR